MNNHKGNLTTDAPAHPISNGMNIRPITETGDLAGKRVLVRVDWNVPMVDGEARDDFRIKHSLPTLEYLKNAGARVIIATHLEPGTASVEPLEKYVPDGMELLENLRSNPGEKNGDEDYAGFLAAKADVFVNEAFSASHRKHASIVGIPELLPSYAGMQFMKEVENLSRAFNPEHPFLLMLGGAKIETKLPLIEKFLPIADSIFIAGLLAVPASEMELGKNPKVFFPQGDIAALDINTETVEILKKKIDESKFVVWNGPVGKYEDGLKEGTLGLTKALAESGKEVIVGGGDTLAAIAELDVFDKFSFVSTGGGAMLDFLANGTLPGIEALEKSAQK